MRNKATGIMGSIFKIVTLTFCVLITLRPISAGGLSVGVCYGLEGDNLPPPSEVVAMYQANNIKRMRLYEPNPLVLEALRGSGIHVLVGVRDQDIETLASSYSAAEDWVETNIRYYWPDVIIHYITVGNEAIPGHYTPFILPAMRNLHNALSVDGLWHRIKVTTAVSSSVMEVSFPPSAGTFSDSVIEDMAPIARYLDSIGAPLLTNIYPYFNYVEDPINITLPYALFTSEFNIFEDDGLKYWNLLDANIDAFYSSLEKVGAPKVRVVVSETGWPSDGNNYAANILYAWMYNSNLMGHVSSSQGTPRRPGLPIETYLFAMFNEEKKLGKTTENHFGLYDLDKKPVYPINFI